MHGTIKRTELEHLGRGPRRRDRRHRRPRAGRRPHALRGAVERQVHLHELPVLNRKIDATF